MLLTALFFLVSSQTDCRPGVPSDGGVAVLWLDLDGDPVPDEVRVVDREVELRVSKPPSTTRLSLGWGLSGGLLVRLGKLPLEGNPRREEALRFIEDAVFSKTCAKPDPSLQRLLQQGQRKRGTPLNWQEGPVAAPFGYLTREKGSWLLYRSYCSTPKGADPFGPVPPQEAARDGSWVVLKTCHGVVLSSLEKNQHAWLYLLDQPIDKLRHSSIGRVAIAEGVVTIELTLDTLEAPDFVEVKVKIADGSITIVKGKRTR